MRSLVRGTVARVTHCASRSLCLTSSGPRMHSHPYFAEEGWQPGEVRTGGGGDNRTTAEALTCLTPGAMPGRPARPWREDSAGFGDSCLTEAEGGEKVGLRQLGWELLVAS